MVDTSAIHINLLPFRSALSTYDLYEGLQKMFTISMTSSELRETALKAPLGPIENPESCPATRPSIGIFAEKDKAVVQFENGPCGKLRAANFLKAHVKQRVRQHIREEIFEVNPDECAPFASEGIYAPNDSPAKESLHFPSIRYEHESS